MCCKTTHIVTVPLRTKQSANVLAHCVIDTRASREAKHALMHSTNRDQIFHPWEIAALNECAKEEGALRKANCMETSAQSRVVSEIVARAGDLLIRILEVAEPHVLLNILADADAVNVHVLCNMFSQQGFNFAHGEGEAAGVPHSVPQYYWCRFCDCMVCAVHK